MDSARLHTGAAGPSSFSAPGGVRLGVDQVHAWVVSLDPDSAESPRRVALTSQAERERAMRFHRREDAEHYLVARGTLRLILAGYLTRDPMSLQFGAHENGKPFVEDAALEFNLSHSGFLALIAVARGRRVGVDIELLRPMHDLETVAARICTPDELATLASLARPVREGAFFTMWTRKEALAKATGEGIVGVFRGAHDPMAEGQNRWTLADLTDLPGYAACVAAEGVGWRLVRCPPSS